jgi:pantoate--beta-alanine ligase
LETLHAIHEVRARVAAWRRQGLTVGFVPTMGNLHQGHLSLVQLAGERADRVIVSIFVNPMQFGPQEDFDRYPRTLERDCQALAQGGAQLVFAPDAAEIYPAGMEQGAVVDVPSLAAVLEGEFRPGHLPGVATVVTKLFNIVTPDLAVFGRKDYQQLLLVQRLVRDLCLPIEIIAGSTVREPDGLALSSRNQYLSAGERRRASTLHDTLVAARRRIIGGERQWLEIEASALGELRSAGFDPDYFTIRNARDLQPPQPGDGELVLLVAARLGRTRLIDNVSVELE